MGEKGNEGATTTAGSTSSAAGLAGQIPREPSSTDLRDLALEQGGQVAAARAGRESAGSDTPPADETGSGTDKNQPVDDDITTGKLELD